MTKFKILAPKSPFSTFRVGGKTGTKYRFVNGIINLENEDAIKFLKNCGWAEEIKIVKKDKELKK